MRVLSVLVVIGLMVVLGGDAFAAHRHAALVVHRHSKVRVIRDAGSSVMHDPTVYAIYWLPHGDSYEPPRSKVPSHHLPRLVSRFLRDLGGSDLYHVITQYYDDHGHISDRLTFGGEWLDRRPYPNGTGTDVHPLRDEAIRQEILRAVAHNHWRVQSNRSLFIVFTGYDIQSCAAPDEKGKRQCTTQDTGYCGYHDVFDHNGKSYVYVNLPDLSDGCNVTGDLISANTSPNNDAVADLEINNVSHELLEAITDPNHDAWGTKGGDEIADLCNYTLGPRAQDGSDVVMHGHPYVLQTEWSNRNGGCVMRVTNGDTYR